MEKLEGERDVSDYLGEVSDRKIPAKVLFRPSLVEGGGKIKQKQRNSTLSKIQRMNAILNSEVSSQNSMNEKNSPKFLPQSFDRIFQIPRRSKMSEQVP